MNTMSSNDSTIERVLLWMVSGLAGSDLENACIAKLEVDPAKVKARRDEIVRAVRFDGWQNTMASVR